MPLSTRSSAKRPAPVHEDPDVPDSSPSRPARKRKRPSTSTTRPPRRPRSPELYAEEDDDLADATSSEAETQDIADTIIPVLTVSSIPVAVATLHANSIAEGASGVQAYAKISGRLWTYYVRRLDVIIGRPPDPDAQYHSTLGGESSPVPREEPSTIDINLAPIKAVSRLHARLYYAVQDQKWHIEVKGRNGVLLNDRKIKRGEESEMACGDVLEIANTQMMFVTAEDRAKIHPMFFDQLEAAKEDKKSAVIDSHPHAHPEASSSQSRIPGIATTSSQVNGKPTIAPAPADFVRPTTPVRSPKKPQRTSSASKPSPAFGRGFMVESSEQIDYRSDATRDLKPTIPYSVMITQAILSKPDEKITLSDIYEWIKAHFAYYRYLTTNWQNSIRHNLSLNPAFDKTARKSGDQGKGMMWYLKQDKRSDMITQVAKHMRKTNARPSSSSPTSTQQGGARITYAPPVPPPQQFSSESNGVPRTSPPTRSPLLTAYPTAQESYTPSRGSRMSAFVNHDPSQNLPALSDDPSPLPIRRNRRPGAMDSSPVLTSGFFDGPMLTPAPRQHNLHDPAPNTIRLPTSHMADSSPAPFWKMGADSLAGSTPARWPEVSPIKMSNGTGGGLQSSSPPPGATNGGGVGNNESPTRNRGTTATMPTNLVSAINSADLVDDDEDDDDEAGIDITKLAPRPLFPRRLPPISQLLFKV
ncbi:MAG: hypothetical protein Q9220_001860 [cf. Caloplaca sp. 1 TL-2023]